MNKNPNQSGLRQNKLKKAEKKRLERLKKEQEKKDKERLELEEFRKNPEESVDRYIHHLVKGDNNATERISNVLLKWWALKQKAPPMEQEIELNMEMLKELGKSFNKPDETTKQAPIHKGD